MILKISHRYAQITTVGGSVPRGREDIVHTGHRNIAKNPDSNSCDSHPKEYLSQNQ